MKCIFLPFINGAAGQTWREDLENDFISNEGKTLTDEINIIRNKKQDHKRKDDYYRELHPKKSERQALWLKRLMGETAALFKNKLEALPADELTSSDTTIIAALPEFYWYDINDNQKHKDDIINYHKPIYSSNLINYLLDIENPLMKLTNDYPNLIIFAGTAMWKYIDYKNKESIYNTLMIFGNGKLLKLWTKVNVSSIDGFSSFNKLVKDKVGHGVITDEPMIVFNGKTFVYDICLDFIAGKNGIPLSSELCNSSADINVLISAGMPIFNKKLSVIKAPVILRCDGNNVSASYAEIRKCDGTELAAQTKDDVIIDDLEADI